MYSRLEELELKSSPPRIRNGLPWTTSLRRGAPGGAIGACGQSGCPPRRRRPGGWGGRKAESRRRRQRGGSKRKALMVNTMTGDFPRLANRCRAAEPGSRPDVPIAAVAAPRERVGSPTDHGSVCVGAHPCNPRSSDEAVGLSAGARATVAGGRHALGEQGGERPSSSRGLFRRRAAHERERFCCHRIAGRGRPHKQADRQRSR